MSPPISGATRVAAVIGHPVAHSLSPALHRAGFESLGVDWAYVAFDVAPGAAAAAVAAVSTLGLGGLSVTMPHKEDAARAVDQLESAAAHLSSVNTVWCDADGRTIGASTDGDGFLASLDEADVDVVGATVGVIGAGGAARAIVDALARRGASDIRVVNRTAERAANAVALAPGVARVAAAGELAGCAVVVNTTSVGMGATGDLPIDPGLLGRTQVVVDIVYHPLRTALLAAASDRGARTVDGLGMLVHQAALQQWRWLGQVPDTRAMRSAAERQLADRGQ